MEILKIKYTYIRNYQNDGKKCEVNINIRVKKKMRRFFFLFCYKTENKNNCFFFFTKTKKHSIINTLFSIVKKPKYEFERSVVRWKEDNILTGKSCTDKKISISIWYFLARTKNVDSRYVLAGK